MTSDANTLHEVDVLSVMVHEEAMERLNHQIEQSLNDCSGDPEMDVVMVMYVDDQGFLYMDLNFENGSQVLCPVSPVEWMPRHAA